MTRKSRTLLLFAFYLVYSLIYAGWLPHRSISPVILRYSASYFSFLLVMATVFFLPVVVRLYARRVGWKGLKYSILVVSIFSLIIYVISGVWYYYTEEHLFDPFLQNPVSKFEDRTPDRGKPSFRILTLGGSTSENLALEEEERYPNVLASILEKRYPSYNIELFNGARNWYTTRHSLIAYVTYYSDWKPDLVIVMHGINDLCRSFSPDRFAIGEYDELWTHFYGPAINGARAPTFEEHLLSFFEVPMDAWYAGLRNKEVDYPLDRYVSLGSFEKNLRRIVKYVKFDNSRILLVSQPSLYKNKMEGREPEALCFGKAIANTRLNFVQSEYPSSKSFFRAMKFFNENAEKVAREEGALFVDAAGDIAKTLNNFRDDLHYTEEGAHLLAESISEAIMEEGLIGDRI